MLKPVDLANSQECLKRELEDQIKNKNDEMEKNMDKNKNDMNNKMDENRKEMKKHMEKKMLELKISMSSMILHALDERLPKEDIKLQGNHENIEEIKCWNTYILIKL